MPSPLPPWEKQSLGPPDCRDALQAKERPPPGPYGPFARVASAPARRGGLPRSQRQTGHTARDWSARSDGDLLRSPVGSDSSGWGIDTSRGALMSPMSHTVHDFHHGRTDDKYSRLQQTEHTRQEKISQSLWQSLCRSIENPTSSYNSSLQHGPALSDKDKKALGLGWKPESFVDRPGINSRWYPHPSHLRGAKKLTKMGLNDRGMDPLRNKAHIDYNWEAPIDRLDRNRKIHAALVGGGGVKTPRTTDHWRSQEALAKPGLYEKPWKVNHVWPVRNDCGGVGSEIHVRPPGPTCRT